MIQVKVQTFIMLASGTSDEANGWIYSGSFWTSVVNILLQILLQVYAILLMCQPLVHTIIAINRLTAFAFPLRHSAIWNRRMVTASILGIALLALVIAGVPYLYFGIVSAVEPPASSELHLQWDILAVGFFVLVLTAKASRGRTFLKKTTFVT